MILGRAPALWTCRGVGGLPCTGWLCGAAPKRTLTTPCGLHFQYRSINHRMDAGLCGSTEAVLLRQQPVVSGHAAPRGSCGRAGEVVSGAGRLPSLEWTRSCCLPLTEQRQKGPLSGEGSFPESSGQPWHLSLDSVCGLTTRVAPEQEVARPSDPWRLPFQASACWSASPGPTAWLVRAF